MLSVQSDALLTKFSGLPVYTRVTRTKIVYHNSVCSFCVGMNCDGRVEQPLCSSLSMPVSNRGSSVAKDATVLAVYEDWPGGAGNALGTLYAFQKATALAKSKGYDLAGKLISGEVRRPVDTLTCPFFFCSPFPRRATYVSE